MDETLKCFDILGVRMAQHVSFHYESLDELKEDIAKLGLDIPVSRDVSILS
jgi:hypothetical protein